MNCQRCFLWVVLLLSIGVFESANIALAQEEPDNPASGEGETFLKSKETLPKYDGEGSFYLGFRLVDRDDSSQAGKYQEDGFSLSFGIDGITCPLPHRYHLHGEFFSEHDFYGDVGYAYKDMLLFRNILVGVHHNLANYNYLFAGSPPTITYADRNATDENFLDFFKNESFLRLKSPDYPLHTFFKHRFVERDGSIEERFLIGDFSNIQKTAQSRKIDWQSNDLTLGLNSHLGPIEIEYAYSLGKFDPGSNSVLFDAYPASFIFGRPGDVYPHNGVPETEFYENTLKFHTSYTGQVVASATFSNAENTNNYSQTEADIWRAAFDLRWIPDPVISLFFKYRHREEDKDNADQVTLFGKINQVTYPVRNLISTKKDLFSLSARYRPLPMLTLIGVYDYEQRKRADQDEWYVLPEESDVHRVSLTAHIKPMDKLKLKGVYDYENYENPSYNTEPDHQNRIRLNATYLPCSWATVYLDYILTLSNRDDLRYLNSNPHLVLTDGERDGQKDHFLGSLSLTFSPEISLSASWAYYRWKIEQDLTYALWKGNGFGGDLPYYDREVPYTDEANIFSFSLFYVLRKDLTLTADVSYTINKSEYLPDEVITDAPQALTSFSAMETTITFGSIELAKKVFNDWEIGLKFGAEIYDDEFSDDGGDHRDGQAYVTMLNLKRYF